MASSDLDDPRIYDSCAPVTGSAHRIVLHIMERGSVDHAVQITGRVKRLREMGFRVALDTRGRGATVRLAPDVVKIDRSVVRGIEADAGRQALARSVGEMAGRCGATVVAEGVETVAGREAMFELGCDQMGGDLFARPTHTFARPILQSGSSATLVIAS